MVQAFGVFLSLKASELECYQEVEVGEPIEGGDMGREQQVKEADVSKCFVIWLVSWNYIVSSGLLPFLAVNFDHKETTCGISENSLSSMQK